MSFSTLSTYIYNKMLSYDETILHYRPIYKFIPINEIDGIQCSTKIYYTNKNLYLQIETNYMYRNDIDDNEDASEITLWCSDIKYNLNPLNEETINICLTKWFSDIEELKFCKLRTKFYKSIEVNMFDFLKNMKNIKCGDDCSVCYEKTQFKTVCNHSVCLSCLTQIKEISDVGDNKYKNCPICRECL